MNAVSNNTGRKQSKFKLLLDEVSAIDKRLSGRIHRLRLNRKLEWCVFIPGVIFGRHVLPLLVFIIALLINFHTGLYVGLCCAFTVILTEPMKYLFGRDRPPEDDVSNRVVPLRKDVTNPSFPSGDSAQAAVIGGVVYSVSKSWLSFLIPIPTMFSRVYFGAHWIGDTIGGYCIGMVMGVYLVPAFVNKIVYLWGDSIGILNL